MNAIDRLIDAIEGEKSLPTHREVHAVRYRIYAGIIT